MAKLLQALTLIRHVLVILLLCALGYGCWLAYPAVKGLPELVLHTNAFLDEATLTARNVRKTTQIVEDNSQVESKAILTTTRQVLNTLLAIQTATTDTSLAINQQLIPQTLQDLHATQIEIGSSLDNLDLQVSSMAPGIADLNSTAYNLKTLTGDPDIPATFLAIRNGSNDLQGAAKDVHQAADMYIQKIRNDLKPVPFALKIFDFALRLAEPAYYVKGTL
jgi:hypothetical protein